ncbi:NAD-dependent deacylase [Caulobacter sp. 17J80-11]|uniref:NAD-dependent deacylase n=1 Tax=Caulobacter sp. 17J80-11 TaxID=2763502 RepID=UPI001653A506|nr:NAD-dependent deacylase [Caulobacter sp. 17J80-11]MBC6981499.1 NAD-dependent deacylase [Caulobacter sp. 17J80-11]
MSRTCPAGPRSSRIARTEATVKLFILTGAGVSAESGLGTFRDAGGIWTRYDLQQVATPEGFARNPVLVHEFYNARRRNLLAAEPNAAHAALARLEQELPGKGGRVFLCTQNVDDLHERAGSRAVHHMHGELFRIRCVHCGDARDWREDLSVFTLCPACRQAGGLRPDVVWFGEEPRDMEMIQRELVQADLFVSIGTSGSVYPAAGFVAEARRAKVRTCEINLQPSDNARRFDQVVYGPATETLPAWVEKVLERA